MELINPNFTARDQDIVKTISNYPLQDHIGTNVVPPPHLNLVQMRDRMYELQSRILFEEPDASNWPQYREELLLDYGGKEIFEEYARQITKAQARP